MTLNSAVASGYDDGTMAAASASADSATEAYDLRLGDDASMGATITILSSAPSASASASSRSLSRGRGDGVDARGGGINVQIAPSMSLSFRPSMVDSSLLQSDASSITSSSEMSLSAISGSTPTHSPEVFANIGRSLMFASASCASSDSSTTHFETACDTDALSKPSVWTEETPTKKVKWWDRLRTDEDWDVFRAKANDYLNALIAEEMKELEHDDHDCGTGGSVDKTSISKGRAPQNNEGFGGIVSWLQGLYESINATILGITSPSNDSTNSRYVTALVKEIAGIKRQLDGLPPMPPPLPKGLALDDLPGESRDLLVEYSLRLDTWRGEVMPERDELQAKYVHCQERLLAAIIDAEEDMFNDKKGGCDSLGAMNDEGYIKVVESGSPEWDKIAQQRKCEQWTLAAALVAALTAGASFFVALQSKRR